MILQKPMRYAGEKSIFETSFEEAAPGEYQVEILASDAANANFGRAVRPLIVGGR